LALYPTLRRLARASGGEVVKDGVNVCSLQDHLSKRSVGGTYEAINKVLALSKLFKCGGVRRTAFQKSSAFFDPVTRNPDNSRSYARGGDFMILTCY